MESCAIIYDQLDRHYRGVLDQPVPMLEGQSLRAAVGTDGGRNKVADWLKMPIAHLPVSLRCELARMRERGLEGGRAPIRGAIGAVHLSRPDAAGHVKMTDLGFGRSSNWRMWLKPESRCLVPFNSFAEYAPEPNPVAASARVWGFKSWPL